MLHVVTSTYLFKKKYINSFNNTTIYDLLLCLNNHNLTQRIRILSPVILILTIEIYPLCVLQRRVLSLQRRVLSLGVGNRFLAIAIFDSLICITGFAL